MGQSRSRRIQQRQRRLWAVLFLVNRTIVALNLLHSGCSSLLASSLREFELIHYYTPLSVWLQFARCFGWAIVSFRDVVSYHIVSPVRERVIVRLYSAVREFAGGRRLLDFGLCGVRHQGDLGDPLDDVNIPPFLEGYGAGIRAGAVVDLRADTVAVPLQAAQIPLLRLLPPEVMTRFAYPSSLVLRDVPLPPPKPVVRVEAGQYIPLIKKLNTAGMVEFLPHPMIVNGLFGVRKPDGSVRLVIDARPANRWFKTPPVVTLPSPEVFSRFVSTAPGAVFIAKSDLDNYYHRLRLPGWLVPFFALPPVRAADVGLRQDTAWTYPCLKSLPMGWSFSVFLAQLAHEFVVYKSGCLSPSAALSGVSSWSLREREVRHLIYIDDVVFFGRCKLAVDSVQERYMSAMNTCGLQLKMTKLVAASAGPVKVLGFMVDGESGVVRLSDAAVDDLDRATSALLAVAEVNGTVFQRLLGKWIWSILPKRLAFAVLAESFRFARVAEGKIFQVWPSVKNEMRVLRALLPLLRTDMYHAVFDRTLATDASLFGFGVTSAPTHLRNEALLEESSPSSRARMVHHRHATASSRLPSSLESSVLFLMQCSVVFLLLLLLILPLYVRLFSWRQYLRNRRRRQRALNHEALLRSSDVSHFGLAPSVVCAVMESVTACVEGWLQGAVGQGGIVAQLLPAVRCTKVWSPYAARLDNEWKTVFAGRWRHHEHINVLELRTIYLALRWCASLPRTVAKRIYVMCDSQVVVAGLHRGRSSSRSLLCIYRRLSALCLALDLCIVPMWVRSEDNPADRPSRGLPLFDAQCLRSVNSAKV